MRHLLSFLLIGLVAAVGCQKSSPKGGVPDTSSSSFTVKVPATAVSVTQGEKNDATISISRGKDYKADVAVEVEVPAGLTITPRTFTFVVGTDDQKVVIEAAPDAAPGTRMTNVKATPTAAGQPTSMHFDVAVKSKT